jgi:enoyl-CoA hydratase/carnithine racemase
VRRWHPEPAAPGRRGLGQAHDPAGERINAETALRIGLAEEKVGKGEAKALALEWAKKAGKQSPTSIAACKTLVQSTRTGTHASALVAERSLRRPVRHRRPGRGRDRLPGKARRAVEERMSTDTVADDTGAVRRARGRQRHAHRHRHAQCAAYAQRFLAADGAPLLKQLNAWADDDGIAMVVLQGAGEGVLCRR